MADQCRIAGNYALLLGLEDAFQMACLSWYIDVQYLTDDAPLLSSLLEAYSQFLLSRFSLYHTMRFSVA
jgi:hypothetical protein